MAQTTTQALRVVVSSDIVSTLTETPGGDYHVPESQVFIGGSKAANFLGGGLLGLIVSNASNASSIGNSESTAQIKFDSTVTQTIKKTTAPEINYLIIPDTSLNDYNVKLLPSARLLVDDENRATLSFRLTARLRLEKTSQEVTKNFHYSTSIPRPLVGNEGWLDKNSAILREESKAAFEKLIFALGEETSGRAKAALQSEKKRIIKIKPEKNQPIVSGLLLAETPQILVIVPMAGGYLLSSIVQVIDKTRVEIVK